MSRRVILVLALVAAGVGAILFSRRRQPASFPPATDSWPPLLDRPGDPVVTDGAVDELPAPEPVARWVDPVDGVCPSSHPFKAKTGSKIVHSPGGSSYDRTAADRCYSSLEAAEADKFRPAKR